MGKKNWSKLWEAQKKAGSQSVYFLCTSEYMKKLFGHLQANSLHAVLREVVSSILEPRYVNANASENGKNQKRELVVCPPLLDGILSLDDPNKLLMTYLKVAKEMPEIELIKCLTYVLRSDDGVKKNDLLDKIISLPFTDIYLKVALGNLSYDDSKALLEYFRVKLEPERAVRVKDLEKMLLWETAVLDINSRKLEQQVRDVLFKLQKSYLNMLESLEEDDEFKQIQRKEILLKEVKKHEEKDHKFDVKFEVLEF